MPPITVLQKMSEEIIQYRRFDLVKIAFEQALAVQARPDRLRDGTASEIAKVVVVYADAVLAAMEMEPAAENPAVAALETVRDELQGYVTSQRAMHVDHPTEDTATMNYRDGYLAGCGDAVDMLGNAIANARTPEPETKNDETQAQ